MGGNKGLFPPIFRAPFRAPKKGVLGKSSPKQTKGGNLKSDSSFYTKYAEPPTKQNKKMDL